MGTKRDTEITQARANPLLHRKTPWQELVNSEPIDIRKSFDRKHIFYFRGGVRFRRLHRLYRKLRTDPIRSNTRWTEREIELVREFAAEGLSRPATAARIERTEAGVKSIAYRYNIKFNSKRRSQ